MKLLIKALINSQLAHCLMLVIYYNRKEKNEIIYIHERVLEIVKKL